MVHCSFYGCQSRSDKKGVGVSFHSFPKHMERFKQWMKNMNVDGWTPSKYDRLCSNHFETKWLYKSNSESRVRLLNQAVPTIFPVLQKYLKPTQTRKIVHDDIPQPGASSSEQTLPDTPQEPKQTWKRVHDAIPQQGASSSEQTLPDTTREPKQTRKRVHIAIPPPGSSEETLSDTPEEKVLQIQIFQETAKSKAKANKIKVLAQSLRRCKKRVVSLEQMVQILESDQV